MEADANTAEHITRYLTQVLNIDPKHKDLRAFVATLTQEAERARLRTDADHTARICTALQQLRHRPTTDTRALQLLDYLVGAELRQRATHALHSFLHRLDVRVQTPKQQAAVHAAAHVLAQLATHDIRGVGHHVLPAHSKSLDRTQDRHQRGVDARAQQQKSKLLSKLKSVCATATLAHVHDLLSQCRPEWPVIPERMQMALAKRERDKQPKVKKTRAQKRADDEQVFGRPTLEPATTATHEICVCYPTGEMRRIQMVDKTR